MRHTVSSALLFMLLALRVGVFAQAPEKPKLVVGIMIENMRYDYLARYADKYQSGGFRRLTTEGAMFTNASYNYLISVPGVGHTSLATGTTPALHGVTDLNIPGKNTGALTEFIADPAFHAVGSTSDVGNKSLRALKVTTIGDELKLSSMFLSRVYSVAMTDYAAILTGGHAINAAYWFDDRAGNMITSSYYAETLPVWANEFNDKRYADLYLERTWATILPLTDYQESVIDDSPYEKGFFGGHTFPYDLKALNKLTREYSVFKETPFANTYLKDFAIALISNELLGKKGHPDLLMLSFSTPRYTAERFGAGSVENQDIYLRLDRDLAHFFTFLDTYLGKDNYLVFLTSDHGNSYEPGMLEQMRIPTGAFNYKALISLTRAYLAAKYGQGDWILSYRNMQVFLNRKLIEDKKLDLREVQKEAAGLIRQMSGVANVYTASELQSQIPSDQVTAFAKNFLHPYHSGDVLVQLLPGWREDRDDGLMPVHSVYSYDNHIPLIFFGWKTKTGHYGEPVFLPDIAPTLAAILGIARPSACTGKPIERLW